MRWTENLVELATKASKVAAKKRTQAAIEKHSQVLKGLEGVVSSQILKDRLGIKRPHDHIRVMERNGLIRKVRHIPQHVEYEILNNLGSSSEEVV